MRLPKKVKSSIPASSYLARFRQARQMTECPIMRTRSPNSNSKGICRPNECTSALPSANSSHRTPNLRVKKWNGFTFPDLRTTKIATGMRTERKCRRAVLGTWVLVTCCCPCSRGVTSRCSWGNTPILHACHRPAKTWQQPENFNFCIFTVLKWQNPHTQLKGDSSLKSFKGTQAKGCCPHPARSVQNSVICGQLPNKPDLL